MEENIKLVQKYLSNNKIYTIMKNKENMICIKDGIIRYSIKINPFSCPCKSSVLCDHKIFVLEKYFKINLIVIIFFHKILKSFYENVSNNNLNEILLKNITDEILNDECGICIQKLINNKNNLSENIEIIHINDITECNTCKKYCHKKCVKRWMEMNKKTNPDKKCVYCNSGEMIF